MGLLRLCLLSYVWRQFYLGARPPIAAPTKQDYVDKGTFFNRHVRAISHVLRVSYAFPFWPSAKRTLYRACSLRALLVKLSLYSPLDYLALSWLRQSSHTHALPVMLRCWKRFHGPLRSDSSSNRQFGQIMFWWSTVHMVLYAIQHILALYFDTAAQLFWRLDHEAIFGLVGCQLPF